MRKMIVLLFSLGLILIIYGYTSDNVYVINIKDTYCAMSSIFIGQWLAVISAMFYGLVFIFSKKKTKESSFF